MNSDKNVFLTRPLPQPQVERLQSLFPRFHHNQENRSLTQTELSKHVKGADALLCLLNDKIDADIIDSAGPQLRIIANYATGYDNIDIAYATQRGICVTNTPDVLTDATADLAWALLLSVSRRIVEAHEYSVKNRFKGWDPILLLGEKSPVKLSELLVPAASAQLWHNDPVDGICQLFITPINTMKLWRAGVQKKQRISRIYCRSQILSPCMSL